VEEEERGKSKKQTPTTASTTGPAIQALLVGSWPDVAPTGRVGVGISVVVEDVLVSTLGVPNFPLTATVYVLVIGHSATTLSAYVSYRGCSHGQSEQLFRSIR
jgi:hypothetical protein